MADDINYSKEELDRLKEFNSEKERELSNLRTELEYKEELPLILAEKTIGSDDVLQLEHLACDVNVPSAFVNAPRKKRFWPTKRYVDLLIFRDPNPQNDEEEIQHKEFQELLKNEYDIEIE